MKSFAEIDHLFQGAVDRNDVPGLVAMVAGQAQILYRAGFGWLDRANKVGMLTEAIFSIQSMTKPVTSVAVMMLSEAGRLKLDDPIASYLPAFKDPQVVTHFDEVKGSYTARPAGREITIRHLLTHTAGLGYGFSNRTWQQLEQLGRRTGQKAKPPLILHEPGQKWTYGMSTRILGRLVEAMSDLSLAEFFRAKIFDPLGMADTFYVVPSEKRGRMVTLHRREGGSLVEQPRPKARPTTFSGDGGLYSTAPDYIKFLQMFLNGGTLSGARILSPASIALMGQNHIGQLVVETQPATDLAVARDFPLGAGRDKFGLGFQITASDTENPHLRSAGSYSWAGLYNTHFWVDPKRDLAAVILMQVLPFYDEACISLYQGFEELVYRNLS